MRPVDTFKLVLAGIAAGLLVWGIRTDNASVRLAGIACLVIAVILRFTSPRPPLN